MLANGVTSSIRISTENPAFQTHTEEKSINEIGYIEITQMENQFGKINMDKIKPFPVGRGFLFIQTLGSNQIDKSPD